MCRPHSLLNDSDTLSRSSIVVFTLSFTTRLQNVTSFITRCEVFWADIAARLINMFFSWSSLWVVFIFICSFVFVFFAVYFVLFSETTVYLLGTNIYYNSNVPCRLGFVTIWCKCFGRCDFFFSSNQQSFTNTTFCWLISNVKLQLA